MSISTSRPGLGLFVGRGTPRLYDRIVGVMRARHYSPRTQETYLGWIRRFIEFCGGRHPREFAEEKVNEFLTYLAVQRRVAAPTQNQALAALLFLYKRVLEQPLGQIEGIVRAPQSKHLPVALTHEEVAVMFAQLEGMPLLVCMVIYGSGLRLMEVLQLRVKDIGFGRGEIIVRRGKGGKDRVTMLPDALRDPVREQLDRVSAQHRTDLAAGLGRVPMPTALVRKYPNADREWPWQWVFSASSHYTDRETGLEHRHHYHETAVQRAVKSAWRRSGLPMEVTSHTFRHSFATQLLRDGYDIRTVQELLGHKDVRTTEIYTHVLNRGGHGVYSPLDRLNGGGPPRLGGPAETR